uniref:Ig-like domain-containing protein n=1 Tax=Amphiprion ocellaris TaxID=80972 RepID=A0A3Q1BAL4_AMPOC
VILVSLVTLFGLVILVSLVTLFGLDAVFVYSCLGGEVILPCNRVNQDQNQNQSCSLVSWTFYRGGQVSFVQEVRGGQVWAESERCGRLSVGFDCSLRLQRLQVYDAGSYMCLQHDQVTSDIYLSLLSLSAASSIIELQPGEHLRLTCVLHTYYDAGSCRYSSMFSLSWMEEDGGEHLLDDDRLNSRCNISLLLQLQPEDDGHRFNCQVDPTRTSRPAFVRFTSSFLFQNPPAVQNQNPVAEDCPVPLPVSRLLLCLVLPVLVVSVGLFTWRLDHKKVQKSEAAMELQVLS